MHLKHLKVSDCYQAIMGPKFRRKEARMCFARGAVFQQKVFFALKFNIFKEIMQKLEDFGRKWKLFKRRTK